MKAGIVTILALCCVFAHARVAPPGYALDSFEACYQRVLEIWRQIPALVDEDKLEAIGVMHYMFTVSQG